MHGRKTASFVLLSRSTAFSKSVYCRLRSNCRPLFLPPGPHEKHDDDRMDDDSWPQEWSHRHTADADANEVQHSERTVGQHPIEVLNGGVARPAGHAQPDQSDAGEAAH